MSEPPNKGKPFQRQNHGWFASKPHSYAELIKHPLVKDWIKRYREGDSQESYARALEKILQATGKNVEEFLALPPDEAKKTVFSIADAIRKQGKYAQAKKVVIAAKGFFETNEKPFKLDKLEKTKYYATPRKKVAYEVIPKRDQVYKMADASLSLKAGLRNRAMILSLFQSGVRENCLCRWTYSMFKAQLFPEVKVPVKLVITSEMDVKLQSYEDLEYYVTFLQRDAAEALKAYLDYRRQRGWQPKDEDPVFVTESTASRDRPMKPSNIWEVIKQPQVAGAAGIDSHALWVRLLRKAFQKVLNQSDIDEDTKEAIMGHKLPGSRGNYFDSHDHDEIAGKYMRCQFDRSAPGQDVLTSGLAKLNASGWNVQALSDAERAAVVPFIMEKIKVKNLPHDLEKIRDKLVSRAQMAEITQLMTIADMNRYIEAANPMRDQRSMRIEEGEREPKKTRRTAHNGGTSIDPLGDDLPFETRITSDEKELMQLVAEGWELLKELKDGRVILRRPNGHDQ